MQKRSTPRDTDRPNVIQVDLPGGVHHFRIPSMLKVAKILKGGNARHMAALLATGKLLQAGDSGGAITLLQASGAEGLSLMGALIGVSWLHTHKDLDTPRDDKDMIAYGEAVYEELHDEGYDTVKLLMIAGYLAKHVQDSIDFDAEVAEKLGFTFPTPDPTPS